MTPIPAPATELRDALLLGRAALAEAHAVRGRHRERESGEHLAGEVLQTEDRRIERLVGVEIDPDAGLRSDLQQHIGGGLDVAVVLQVGTPADEVGAGGQCIAQERPMVGAGGPDHRAPGQRDDLDIDHVGNAAADLDEREGVHQPSVHGGVGVGPHGDVAVGGHEACRPFGAFDDVVRVDLAVEADHGIDGAAEITGDVLGPFGEEGLVEMGMGLHCGRQEQVAAEIDRDVCRRRDLGADLGDHTVDDEHVDRAVTLLGRDSTRLVCHGWMNNRGLL